LKETGQVILHGKDFKRKPEALRLKIRRRGEIRW
jgi:hypothetical protein